MNRLAPIVLACSLLACSSKKAGGGAPWLTEPDAATHSARYFPISAGDVHGPSPGNPPITCNDCHADRTQPSSDVPPKYPPSTSFATYSCTTCHVEVLPGSGVFHDDIAALAAMGAHAGEAAFDPAQPLAFDQACYGCHRSGSGAPVYHAQLFPIGAATMHAGIACASCHGNGADRSDLTALQCAACHADPTRSPKFPTLHPAVTSQANGGTIAILVQIATPVTSCTPSPLPAPGSAECLACHARSHVDRVELAPAAGGHPVSNETFGNDRHEGAGCLTCHTATTQVGATVASGPAPKPYPAVDFSQPAGATQQSSGCATCHANGCGNNGP